jgi:hypothetical protein
MAKLVLFMRRLHAPDLFARTPKRCFATLSCNQLAPHDRTDVMSRRRDKHGGLGTTHVANGASSPASAAATAQQQRSSSDRGGSVTSANMVVVVVVVVATLAAFGWSTLTLHVHGSAQANAGSLQDDAVVHATAASCEASTCASSPSSPSSGCDGTARSNDVTSATLAEAVQREAVTTPVVDSGELSKPREGAADEVASATATSNTGVGGSSDNSGSTSSSSSSAGGSGVGGDGGGSGGGGGGVRGKQVRQWSEQYHALTLDLETLKLVFRDLPADNFGALGRTAATGRTAKVRKSGFTHARNEHTDARNRVQCRKPLARQPTRRPRAFHHFCNHVAIPSLASMRPQPPLCVSV